jgi:hypothetical protein
MTARIKRQKPPDLDVTIQPPQTPDPDRTARCLRGLRELAEQIRARLEREGREKEKRNDAA